jgi:hypothetical protein
MKNEKPDCTFPLIQHKNPPITECRAEDEPQGDHGHDENGLGVVLGGEQDNAQRMAEGVGVCHGAADHVAHVAQGHCPLIRMELDGIGVEKCQQCQAHSKR